MSKAHFGLIYSKTEEFLKGRGLGKNIEGAKTLQEFVNKLERHSSRICK